MWTKIIILAIIGSLIGWITNILAIKLIFRPIQPIQLPFKIQIQGLIPKRREELAKSIGDTIENELISIEEILEKVMEHHDKNEVITTIKQKVHLVVLQKIPTFIPKAFKDLILNYLNEILEDELEPNINEMIEDLTNKVTNNVRIGEMVERKINEFDLLRLESIIISISRRELKQIEYLGGILGFAIGVIQAIIILLI